MMHDIPESNAPQIEDDGKCSWWALLTKYHKFVLVVAALGWLFDTMDQQLFNLARVPAMRELLAPEKGVPAAQSDVTFYSSLSTSIFLMGWATGGLAFGIMGDRVGRAKTMLLTILLYSAFTGLSALSVGFWDFAAYRFLTGLGVGGEFAVGISLVAEVMPTRARPFALGLLQALSAVGNITAALVSLGLSDLEESGAVGSARGVMFVIGTLPALLAVLIRRNLKEPETWKAAAVDGQLQKQMGSYAELFGTPRWRKNAIVGLILASSGVVGLWGIGFFSIDLNQSIFRKTFEQIVRDEKQVENDPPFVRTLIEKPEKLTLPEIKAVGPVAILDPSFADPTKPTKDVAALYGALLDLASANAKAEKDPSATKVAITGEAVLAELDRETKTRKPQKPADRERRALLLTGSTLDDAGLLATATQIEKRSKFINGRVSRWAALTSIMLNIGAFFGIYAFSRVTHIIGRRPAFAISFVLAALSAAFVFWNMKQFSDLFWMVPIMGFCQLALFGGYAIYFPELFPTRLRSTGTSFCYNVGRFVAAIGPFTFGYLTSNVFGDYPEPMRYAGVTMCSVFIVGLLALPFAPETRGQPLPE